MPTLSVRGPSSTITACCLIVVHQHFVHLRRTLAREVESSDDDLILQSLNGFIILIRRWLQKVDHILDTANNNITHRFDIVSTHHEPTCCMRSEHDWLHQLYERILPQSFSPRRPHITHQSMCL